MPLVTTLTKEPLKENYEYALVPDAKKMKVAKECGYDQYRKPTCPEMVLN